MRRGGKPARAKLGAKLPVARKSRKNDDSRGRQLAKRLAEAVEQQAAVFEEFRLVGSAMPTPVLLLDTSTSPSPGGPLPGHGE